jgi:hypothetical protein
MRTLKNILSIFGSRSGLLLTGLTLMLVGCSGGGPAKLEINTEPPGAALTIDGTDVGRTPYVMPQPLHGQYLIRLQKEGYHTEEKILDIGSKTPSQMVFRLRQMNGLVLFDSNPAGADVTVNGVFRGKSPLFVTDLPTGTHRATFVLEGFDPREMEVVIDNRVPKLCKMTMKSIYAVLNIESTPTGASVFVDGLHKGKTPCTVEDVVLGNHVLKVLKDGYKEYSEQLSLTKTDEMAVKVQLEELLAALDVLTSPSDARVTVNGEFKGRTPLQVSGLRDGKYDVVIEKPGFSKISQTLDIRKNKDAKIDVTLERSTGSVVLNVLPIGSNLIVADTDIRGVTTRDPFTFDLDPGSYKLEISKPGHHTQTIDLSIEPRKAFTRTITLKKVWKKDTVLQLKDGRVRDGMLIARYPNGTIKLESAPGVFEEFTAGEIKTVVESPPEE